MEKTRAIAMPATGRILPRTTTQRASKPKPRDIKTDWNIDDKPTPTVLSNPKTPANFSQHFR